MENSDHFISIIIVSWNVKDLLRACIFTLENKMTGLSYEIIVVDNASKDRSVEMLKAEFPHVILIKNDMNLGFAAANNQAAKIARGAYLLFVNPDTELQTIIQPMIEHLQKPQVAACFGKLVDRDGKVQIHTLKRFPTVLNQIMELSGLANFFPSVSCLSEEERNLKAYDRKHAIDWGAGAFFLLKKPPQNLKKSKQKRKSSTNP